MQIHSVGLRQQSPSVRLFTNAALNYHCVSLDLSRPPLLSDCKQTTENLSVSLIYCCLQTETVGAPGGFAEAFFSHLQYVRDT